MFGFVFFFWQFITSMVSLPALDKWHYFCNGSQDRRIHRLLKGTLSMSYWSEGDHNMILLYHFALWDDNEIMLINSSMWNYNGLIFSVILLFCLLSGRGQIFLTYHRKLVMFLSNQLSNPSLPLITRYYTDLHSANLIFSNWLNTAKPNPTNFDL